MKSNKITCPQCGSCNIVHEELQQIGHVRRVLKDGTIGKRSKLIEYDGEGDLLYCKDCGYNFDEECWQIKNGKIVLLKDFSEEGGDE